MANISNDLINHIKVIWNTMTLGQKATSSFVVIFVTTIFMVLTFWAKQPDYETLFSNLNMDDAGVIVENLKSNKIPYQIMSGGTQILVPQDKVYETRLNLAKQSLPSRGGIGFELFDKNGFGMTDFTQKINYQRALQGELSRTIDEMEEVEHSRIHLVLPQESIFTEKEKPATGSVILKLKTGRNLSNMQVQGIIHLIASSVEGLDPGNVTVVTTDGKVLSKPKDKEDIFSLGEKNLEYQHAIEMKLKNSIQSMLEEVLGPNKSVVRVAAEIDSNKIERTSELFDAENPVIRSEQRTLENDAASGKTTKKNEVLNYEINKTIERKMDTPGKIKRLYVAAFIDGKMEMAKDKDDQETRKYVSRTPEEMEEIKKIIMKAVGYNPSRGDEIEVVNMEFDYNYMHDQKFVMEKEENKIFWMNLSKNIGIGLIGLFFMYFLFNIFSKNIKTAGLSLQAEYNQKKAVGMTGAALLSPAEIQSASNADELMNTISDFARKNPEGASKLVAGWLAESKPKKKK